MFRSSSLLCWGGRMVNSGLRCDRDGEIDESRLRFVLMKLSCYPPIDDTQSTPHQECDSRRVRLSTRAIMTGRCHPLSVRFTTITKLSSAFRLTVFCDWMSSVVIDLLLFCFRKKNEGLTYVEFRWENQQFHRDSDTVSPTAQITTPQPTNEATFSARIYPYPSHSSVLKHLSPLSFNIFNE